MTTSNLAQNILSQAESLSGVLRYQHRDGAEALAAAATLLRSGRRVLITGIGASLYASIPLEYALCSAGIDATAIEAGELLHYRAAGIRDAVAVVVSRSGESVEITKLLEILKARNTVIGVSNEPQSPLARNAEIGIHIGSLPDEIVAIQTYTGTLLTLHLLVSAVNHAGDAAAEAIESLLPSFAAAVSGSMEKLSQWDLFFSGDSPVYLLARGPSCASAYEGALLMNEVAKTPAIGIPAASFRHGPVEIVDPKFRGIVFTPRGRTQDLNLALVRDLARFGGQIRVIGASPADSASAVQGYDPTPVPEPLAPLFEIVPVQAAALRLAELRGISPGSFRYAPQVTRDEVNFNHGGRNGK